MMNDATPPADELFVTQFLRSKAKYPNTPGFLSGKRFSLCYNFLCTCTF